MRLSHFAKLEVIVPRITYPQTSEAVLKTVGMAQNINIDDNFGSRAENTIGSPLPVLAPGYQQTTIRIEKATIDGEDFRNLGAFNPLWAHIGSTYQAPLALDKSTFELGELTGPGMYPFMFVMRVRNKISRSAEFSNILSDEPLGEDSILNDFVPSGSPAPLGIGGRSNSFGIYACVLQQANISATSQQAVIMDSVTAIARPVKGTWLNDRIRTAFSSPSGVEDVRNGMGTLIYDVLYGYIQ
jgi:hypothetical protein